MAFPDGSRRTPEWAAYPDVSTLLVPGWVPDISRLLPDALDVRSSGIISGTVPHASMVRSFGNVMQNKGMVLDVGCGIGHNYEVGDSVSTFVGLLANVYGVDPLVGSEYDSQAIPDRAVYGFAESMPFQDEVFDLTFSGRCVGWYTDITVNPFWAIMEMIRVTRPDGVISISIGTGESSIRDTHYRSILRALDKVNETSTGDRIKIVKDFYNRDSSQIAIRLK